MLDMAELHKLLSVDKCTTTRLIAPLIGRRLLVRERASRDPRAAMLTLTGEGREVHRQASQSLKALIGAIRKEIPVGKQDACLEGSRLSSPSSETGGSRRSVSFRSP
jgi:DNA-binding MarR family transcriptional regulator